MASSISQVFRLQTQFWKHASENLFFGVSLMVNKCYVKYLGYYQTNVCGNWPEQLYSAANSPQKYEIWRPKQIPCHPCHIFFLFNGVLLHSASSHNIAHIQPLLQYLSTWELSRKDVFQTLRRYTEDQWVCEVLKTNKELYKGRKSEQWNKQKKKEQNVSASKKKKPSPFLYRMINISIPWRGIFSIFHNIHIYIHTYG